MKSLYVKDLTKSLIITGETFLIQDAQRAQDKNGNDYYKLVLSDKTGRVDAKIWSDKLVEIPRQLIKPGNLALISGKVEEYKGSSQVNIYGMAAVDETILDEFIESSKFNADEMMAELEKEINEIKKINLRDVLLSMINDKELNRKLKFWPAGRSVHHSFRSGMLQHILEMIAISKGLMKYYPEADYDILKAGIIMHDIGKLEELGNSPVGTEYSKKGSLLGHISIGLLLFHDFAKGKLDENTYLHICHLILSHHGSHEYGSPVLPSTTEAVMLTNIDNLSSKARTADDAVQKLRDSKEEFSDFNRWLGGVKIWNGNSEGEVSVEPSDIPDLDESGDVEGDPTLI
jgi:3'-5' exoribonuclease